MFTMYHDFGHTVLANIAHCNQTAPRGKSNQVLHCLILQAVLLAYEL